ncbi:cellulose synthase-like protein H1 isoform X2 [Cicer arietinum]|uniref:Cellulose synthase-like protein H1 isoform X2 n=1 Tax=Cicer arietinum TaxID=3827 RepID=A0A1S2XCZ6_CICAR|nr:cellulose synthase-like protein H1 isoform X2 [Cicer arietinum]
MANQSSLPLYEKIWAKHTFSRIMDSLTLLLLFLLLGYRISSHNNHTFPYFVAFLCESWFTITWITTMSTKWTPSHTKTFLDRLLLRVSESKLPPLDIFVTTADPALEPPIITVNTVLSLLALDYPANKLACYVSDDGCSPLTFYALVEATKFAKLWVPFCKKYNVQCRAPFRYFCDEEMANHDLPEFKQEWFKIKEEYEQLSGKIENAAQNSIPCELVGEFDIFSQTKPRNHSTIIKVIRENKGGLSNVVPHIIYISREKRPKHPHHHKAGAMNVLTRISGLMTNAPFILNVDCDMYVNNSKIALHALCILLDSKGEKEVAFAQCPQRFYDAVKDDAYGNQLVALPMYIGSGFAGLQGIIYAGTNCFHRRKVIYGVSPHHDIQNANKDHHGLANDKETMQKFGTSKGFVESVTHVLEGMTLDFYKSLDVKAARKVASCDYEYNTAWGKQVGWLYGSTSEDVLTGLKFHTKGWRSELCSTDPIAFMGCSPQDNLGQMAQHKRWSTGLLDIFLSKHCPIFGTLFGKLQLRECLAYIWITNWALRSVPEICYALLPAYCIITNSNFLPNQESSMWIPTTLFVIYNISNLFEHIKSGLSIRTWWNNQRMGRITTMNSCFLGFLTILLKHLRISDTPFEITKKEQPSSNENVGRFIFNESLIFLPGTTILMVQFIALFMSLLEWQPLVSNGYGVGEVFCSGYVVLCYLPFLKGLFGKGKYGIPLSTICKSTVLAFLFVHFCSKTIAN